jgi:DnaK suppressor protein
MKMNKKDLKKFKKLLEDEKARLVNELGHIEKSVMGRSLREASGDLSAYSFHMADVGTDAQERESVFQYATTEGRVLYDIEDALRKIELGEYGICEDCEKPIERVRLEALPHARMCLKCQERADRQAG